jgi:hypothetical protein
VRSEGEGVRGEGMRAGGNLARFRIIGGVGLFVLPQGTTFIAFCCK